MKFLNVLFYTDAGGGGGFDDLKSVILRRMRKLAQERKSNSKDKKTSHFVMPVGLFLVIDKENGGDITAQELFDRFDLLNLESKQFIDFYFLGWEWIREGERKKGIKFNLDAFNDCRETLKKFGIKQFGGNADLILVDAEYYSDKKVKLDFSKAIYINLSSNVQSQNIPPLGEFLQSIISVAEELSTTAQNDVNIVWSISDKLGIATSKKSLLDFIFEKFGKIIGAKKLSVIAVKNLGPSVDLNKIEDGALGIVSKGPQFSWE
jgi:hypothetical protein